ncbi:hypothetical protein ACIRD3_06820 [Kitasatospora sp. NPDC093550]|uniref:hypothetical protein n=1 Tax=Kitasatospora sp. NPDC093550 TaxID=3364089 RepID=UPI003803E2C3
MAVFVCAGCEGELSVPVSRVALPAHAHGEGGDRFLPPVLQPGSYAVDPEPSGPPFRSWSGIGAREAAARGVYAPVPALSFAPPGRILLAPGDTRGTVLIPERCDGCCASDGRLGPNLACARCGREVGTRIDDCHHWQAVWFEPDAVRELPVEGPTRPAGDGWSVPGLPPVEPQGWWSAQWRAAVGTTLADLLAASGGEPLDLPEGLLTETFGHTLAGVLPCGTPARRVALAGPGLVPPIPPAAPVSPVASPDIALVPRHPWTGAVWQPSDGSVPVPLDAEVWTYLAFPQPASPTRLPEGVERDDPLPLRPHRLFTPDRWLLLHRLARLPTVREPWLRAIYDRLAADGPF